MKIFSKILIYLFNGKDFPQRNAHDVARQLCWMDFSFFLLLHVVGKNLFFPRLLISASSRIKGRLNIHSYSFFR